MNDTHPSITSCESIIADGGADSWREWDDPYEYGYSEIPADLPFLALLRCLNKQAPTELESKLPSVTRSLESWRDQWRFSRLGSGQLAQALQPALRPLVRSLHLSESVLDSFSHSLELSRLLQSFSDVREVSLGGDWQSTFPAFSEVFPRVSSLILEGTCDAASLRQLARAPLPLALQHLGGNVPSDAAEARELVAIVREAVPPEAALTLLLDDASAVHVLADGLSGHEGPVTLFLSLTPQVVDEVSAKPETRRFLERCVVDILVSKLSDDAFHRIAEMPAFEHVRRLTMGHDLSSVDAYRGNVQRGPQFWSDLVTGVWANTIREIDVGDCDLPFQMNRPGANVCLPSLRRLRIVCGTLTAEHDAVVAIDTPSLTELDLCCNKLSRKTLMATLKRFSVSRLSTLHLSGNPIRDEGIEALMGSPLWQSLRSLEVSACELTDAGIKAIAASDTAGLFHLDLSENPINGAGKGVSTRSLMLSSLRSLRLRDCGLTDSWIESLAASFKRSALRVLDLDANQLSVEAVRAIVETGVYRNLWHLGLALNPIADEGARLLAQTEHEADLVKLDVSICGLSTKGYSELVNRYGVAVVCELAGT